MVAVLSPDPVASLTTPGVRTAPVRGAGRREFIFLVSLLMAMGALSIDLMLPAFPDIRREFGMAPDSSQVGWIITAFFLGLAIGPLLYGPVSDRFCRRAPLFAGMVTYVVPMIALLWGQFDGERLTGGQLAAIAGALAMVAVVQWRAAKPVVPATAEPPA